MTPQVLAHLPLYVGQIVILATIMTGYWVILRRISSKTSQIQQQAMDLTVQQQELALLTAKTLEHARGEAASAVAGLVLSEAEGVRTLAVQVAKTLERERAESAEAVAGLVVAEAAGVRAKVEAAAQSFEGGLTAGAGVVNEKLDVLTSHGAHDTNAKLDTILHHSKEAAKGPVKVEVTNTPLEIVPKGGQP